MRKIELKTKKDKYLKYNGSNHELYFLLSFCFKRKTFRFLKVKCNNCINIILKYSEV